MATYRHAKGPSALQIIITVLVVLLSIAILAGAVYAVYHFVIDKEEVQETVPPTQPATVATLDEAPTEAETVDPDAIYTEKAQEYIKNMTDDEKIYQMLVVSPEALTGVDVATVAGDATKQAIKTYPVGGILYDADNFEDAKQTTELIKNSQSFAKLPMFIAVAEEGGENSPVASKLSTTAFENMSTYTEEGEVTAFNNAATIAKDLSKLGFNLNLAPVANLTGDNAYATDSAVASPLIAQAVNGMQENSVIATLKSFPVESDSDKDADTLRASEFLPFSAGIQNAVGAIMIGNAKLSAIDNDDPAFMSQRIVTELLVKELKFGGVVISPDLSDTDITSNYSVDEIVTGSLNAGVNLFLAPQSIDEYVQSIKSALENGTVTQEQIDSSVTKILALKFKYGILTESTTVNATEAATEDIE
ncbi:MAG: hypothetical protein IJE16_03790 [Ruminococcus sp.]|nr:hypothetical protein [Ruminococcus sp.]